MCTVQKHLSEKTIVCCCFSMVFFAPPRGGPDPGTALFFSEASSDPETAKRLCSRPLERPRTTILSFFDPGGLPERAIFLAPGARFKAFFWKPRGGLLRINFCLRTFGWPTVCVFFFCSSKWLELLPTFFRHGFPPHTPKTPIFRHVSAPHISATCPMIYQRASQTRHYKSDQ